MINTACPLILQDLFFYDFKSAYPRIMESIGYDFGDIDLNDKPARNKAIGIAQIDNPNLSSFLMDSVDQLLNFYLKENGIKDEDIIISQRDGFILTKLLYTSDVLMELDFRGHINLVIISPDRQKYIAFHDDGIIDVKGLRNYYPELNVIYQKFSKLNMFNKKTMYKQLSQIKDFVFTCSDKKIFMVEMNDSYFVQTNNLGVIEVQNSSYFKLKNIDREKYFDHYIKEFLQSIHLEFF